MHSPPMPAPMIATLKGLGETFADDMALQVGDEDFSKEKAESMAEQYYKLRYSFG